MTAIKKPATALPSMVRFYDSNGFVYREAIDRAATRISKADGAYTELVGALRGFVRNAYSEDTETRVYWEQEARALLRSLGEGV